MVDLARASSFRSGVVVADSALRTKQTSAPELRSVLAACTRWPGVQRARQVVAFADARAESVLESISRVAFRNQRLSDPDLQVWRDAELRAAGFEVVHFTWEEITRVPTRVAAAIRAAFDRAARSP